VGHNRNGSSCAVLDDHVSRFAESSASVCHVVDDDGGAALDVTDEDHAADFVRASTLFVDERELDVEAVGDGSCSVYPVSANHAHKHTREPLCPTSSLLQHRVKQ